MEPVNRFLAGLHRIDANFPARERGRADQGVKAAEKNARLTNLLDNLPEFERLLIELLRETERQAPESV